MRGFRPHTRSLRYLALDVLFYVFPWLDRFRPTRALPQPDLDNVRLAIAASICIRQHGMEDIDEHGPEVQRWMNLPRVPYRRKLLMIQAGVTVDQAPACALDDEALRTMIALNRMVAR